MKLYTSYLCFAILILLYSCKPRICNDSCCGETFEPQYRLLSGLGYQVGSVEYLNNNSFPSFNSNYSNKYTDAAIKINAEEFQMMGFNQDPPLVWGFVNTAYACSPPEPNTINTILKLVITSSDTIFSENRFYIKGDTLNDLFKAVLNEYEDISRLPLVDDYISSKQTSTPIFYTYGSHLMVQFNEKVWFSSQSINFEFFFDDGAIIDVVVPNFKISDQ